MSRDIETLTIREFAALDEHAAAWDALTASSPQGVPMLSHAWNRAWLASRLPMGATWRVVLAFRDARLVGAWPITTLPHRVLRRWRAREVVGWDCATPYGDLLLVDEAAAAVLQAMLREAARHRPRVLAYEWGGVRDGAPLLEALGQAAPVGRVLKKVDVPGAFVPTTGPREVWWRGVSKNLKKQLRQVTNRHLREIGEETRVEVVRGAPEHLATYLDVEDRSWKHAAGTTMRQVAGERDFAERFVRLAAERGWLEWHFLHAAGGIRAAHLALRIGRRLTLLEIAFDAAHERFSPGALLMEEVLAHAFDDAETDEVNFLNFLPWQERWQPTRDTNWYVRLYPRGPLPWMFGWLPARMRIAAKRLKARTGG